MWTLLLLLLTRWIPTAYGQAFCALSEKTFCLYSEERGSSQIALRLHAYKSVGWIAVGFGTSMSNADVYVAWKGTDGKVYLSRRQSKGTVMPTMVSQSFISNGTYVKGNEWYITFLRQKTLPTNATGVKPSITSSKQSIIWALGSNTQSNNAASSFSIHPMTNGYGIVDVQLFSTLSKFSGSAGPAKISGTTTKDKSKAILIHGILMFIAWGVCAPAGILIARYFKNEMGVWWFRAHIAFMGVLVGGLSIAGLVVMFKEIPDRHFDMNKYNSPFGIHVIVGLVIFIILFLQIAQGVIIDRLWNPKRRSIPWWDKLHWWMGRIIFLLSIANIPLGMVLMTVMSYTISNVIIGIVALWLFLVFLAFGILQVLKGQTHHKEPTPARANLNDSPFNPTSNMSTRKYYDYNY